MRRLATMQEQGHKVTLAKVHPDMVVFDIDNGWDVIKVKPPFLPGEKCYVREAWTTTRAGMLLKLPERVLYKADFVGQEGFVDWKWSSPVTMPQWAARSFVTILSCEPVRVSEVTEEDCLAVGLKKITKDNGRTWKYGMADRDGLPGTDNTGWAWADWKVDYKEAFKVWWHKLHPGKEWAWRVESEEETVAN